MASLFAVGLPFTYDGTTNHFATTTGGSATVAAVTSADDVTVDSLSGNATLTIGAAWSCKTLTINNASATVACDGTHGITASGAVTLTTGTLNTNGQTCSWGSWVSTGSATRSYNITNSSITVTATGTAWNDVQTGLTATNTGATITLSGLSAGIAMPAMNSTSTIAFTGGGNCNLFNSSAIGNLTYTGTSLKTCSLVWGAGHTISGTFTVNGQSVINRVLIKATALGTRQTITSNGTNSFTNVDFQDIAGAGTANWNLASITGNSGDCGNNSGITFTTPATQTATGTASFTWSTHGWTSRVPLPQDNVVVSNAFVAGRTVTMDMPRLGANIDFSSSTGAPTLSLSASGAVFGNLSYAANNVPAAGNTLTFSGRGSQTITTNGVSLAHTVTFDCGAGTYTLQDNLNLPVSRAINLVTGILNTNTKTLSIGALSFSNSNTRTLTITNSIINLTGNASGVGTIWSAVTTTGLTFNSSGSTINITDTSVNGKTFAGGGLSYGALGITGGGSGAVTFTEANTFASLPQVTGGTVSIVWPGSTTTTFNTGGNFGNGTNVITMTASAGSATLSFGTKVNADYLNLTNIPATTTTPAYAGTHSTDGGGNTNWTFTAAPATGSTLMMMGVG